MPGLFREQIASMTDGGANSLDYQDRIVAFIDVLGFADLVKASSARDAAKDQVGRLLTIYRVFDWFVTNMLGSLVAGTFFSDSFILSARDDQVLYLLRETGNLCRYLLLEGFPCRGAIAFGQLHQTGRIMIGPALVDAYRAEHSLAIYPRILLDEGTRSLWTEECAPDSEHHCLKSLARRDTDGQYYLDILDPLWESFVPWSDDHLREVVPSDPARFLVATSERIKRGLNLNAGNEKIRNKYTWLANECERHAVTLNIRLA
jgi:hypothetical protein